MLCRPAPAALHRGARCARPRLCCQTRGISQDDSHAALCRELLVLAERGSVVPAERRLQSFAPSSLLSPTEGAMFAAAASPLRFRGAAFRSLLLAAINAGDAERTARFAAGFSKLLPDGSSSMTMQAERDSQLENAPSGAEVLGRLLCQTDAEKATQWLASLHGAGPLAETLRHRLAVHAARHYRDLERAWSQLLSSSVVVEDAAAASQQALQRLAQGPEPLRTELWLQRLEGAAGPWPIDQDTGLLAAARQGRPRATLRFLRRRAGHLRAWLRNGTSTRNEDQSAGLDQKMLVFLACERGGQSGLAVQWLRCIQAAGHVPQVQYFAYTMRALAKEGLARDAERCFRDMVRCLEATTSEYTILIRACAKLGDSKRALAWITRMHAAFVNVDVFGYNGLLGAYAAEADFQSAFKLIKDMECGVLNGVSPDAASFAAAANAACTAASFSTTRARRHFLDAAEQLAERSRAAMVEVDGAVYQRILRHSARHGDAERVGRFLRRMSSLSMEPGPSALLEALQASGAAPFLGSALDLADGLGNRGAILLARPFAELGDWRGVQRLQTTATAVSAVSAVSAAEPASVWPMLRLAALAEAVPRRRQRCLEAAGDFLLAGGRLSAQDDDEVCSAAAVLLRRGLGGRAVRERRRSAAAAAPLTNHAGLAGCRHSHLICAGRVSAALDSGDPRRAEAWLCRKDSWRDHIVVLLVLVMRRQEDMRRRSVEDRGKPSPQQRYRESAEERGLAAAARLAAAVAAATSHHPAQAAHAHPPGEKFRLRRHSAIGCRTVPGQPTPPVRQAWGAPPEAPKEARPCLALGAPPHYGHVWHVHRAPDVLRDRQHPFGHAALIPAGVKREALPSTARSGRGKPQERTLGLLLWAYEPPVHCRAMGGTQQRDAALGRSSLLRLQLWDGVRAQGA
ncbi:unnamed protein product [Symbiodinium natans]|uniref:Pentatricopeptide repeat-containing protein, chloroplastic n=1 Tax=Symbiodinium natans TaxID=878477 RepID=A0A812QAY8_9DINO|nr:unnamed protein product [Symbiodinium natans]